MPNTIKLVGEDKMIEFDGRGVEFLMPKGGGVSWKRKKKNGNTSSKPPRVLPPINTPHRTVWVGGKNPFDRIQARTP